MAIGTRASMRTIGICAGAAGGASFLALLILAGYGFISSFFLGLLVAAVVAVILLTWWQRESNTGEPAVDSRTTTPSAMASEIPEAGSDRSAAQMAPSPDPVTAAAVIDVPDDPAPAKDERAGSAATQAPDSPPEPDPVQDAQGAAPTADDNDDAVSNTQEPVISTDDPVSPASAPSATAGKPATLTAPRDGGADDLKQIKGVGPKLEQVCNAMGIYHFDQIAGWSDAEIAWVDENLEGFHGRVSRDEWVSQARTLAAGEETDFSRRVGDGGVY